MQLYGFFTANKARWRFKTTHSKPQYPKIPGVVNFPQNSGFLRTLIPIPSVLSVIVNPPIFPRYETRELEVFGSDIILPTIPVILPLHVTEFEEDEQPLSVQNKILSASLLFSRP